MTTRAARRQWGQTALHAIFAVLSMLYVLPFALMISVSLSEEKSLTDGGFSIWPKAFSLDAYRLAFRNPEQLLSSYQVTIAFTVAGMALSTFILAMMAYALSRPNFRFRKALSFFAFFTMLFSGGLVPSYLLNVKYLHLDNTIWVYILPSLVSAWNLIIMRTNFRQIPASLIESAKIDGAGEAFICFRIVIPLSAPVLATISFFFFVGKWNDWFTTVLYIKSPSLFSLQYMLQRILREAAFLKQMTREAAAYEAGAVIPTESFRFAMALLASGPVLAAFPFFQKYLNKGLTIGAVKE
jgi:putative aldouronate transport system permease protein